MSDIKKDLGNSSGDYVHSVVRTGLSAIPIIGGGASELFSLLIAPPVSKRRDRWLVKVAEGIEELKEKIHEFDINSLAENEVFITTVLQASQIAIRNHQEEKLVALRNAVLNSAVGIDVEESIQLMFLSLIDTITPWHLRILKLFQNPSSWTIEHNKQFYSLGSPVELLESAFPELRGRRDFYDVIIKDLNTQGLIGIDSLHIMMTGSGVMAPRTTTFGNQFLTYISFPQ
ncbi:hypothetical protein [Paenibacillus sophorae]|uniref:Uncharacterized protein n=1 Tax=Paenibacillus sophorae TaxID=1333845 RepID=A0ABX8HGE8_9BACL|nr:hypothetical protein [Paenibacillus sophorae]QWU17379.1 hypothetical protein KP014_09615 [Paenibacillus sophorae]